MSSGRKWVVPLAVWLLVLAAVGWLFQARLGGGDVYPPYSSFRADALGTRALYEALSSVPGLQVERDYRPLANLGTQSRLILLSGLDWQQWQSIPANQLEALNTAALHGARVVLAFRADIVGDDPDESDERAKKKKPAEEKATGAKKAEDTTEEKKKKAKRPGEVLWESKDLGKEWKVGFKRRWLAVKDAGAKRTADSPAGLPDRVAWQSDVYFSVVADSGWRVLYRRAGEAVLIEKSMGRGSIVLLADAYCLSNETIQKERATALLSYLVGEYGRISFVESTLGVLEENGVGFLARRYGLGGALTLCVLLGMLYTWRRIVAFSPPSASDEADREITLAYEPAAGFTGLLRRSLSPAEVLPACVAEWKKSRRSDGNAVAADRLETVWQAHDPKTPLPETYNALARALKPR